MSLAAYCSGGSLIKAITSLTQNLMVVLELFVLSYNSEEYHVHI